MRFNIPTLGILKLAARNLTKSKDIKKLKKWIKLEEQFKKKINKPLTLYRAENYPGQAPFMRPDTDPKSELVGRWFTTNKDFVDKFAQQTKDTKGIKKLTVKPPITYSDNKKSINQLIKDRKTLKDWVPEMGMGSGSRKLSPYYEPGGDVTKTRLEYFLGSKDLRNKITLTPPKEITDTAKFDTWLSLLAILKNKNPKMFKEILNLIKAKRMGLKDGGIV